MDVLAHIPGYISVLESKDRGKGLSQALDAITPTLEVGPQLRSAKQFFYRSTEAIAAGTVINPSVPVPSGEIWHILAVEAAFSAPTDGQANGFCVQLIPACQVGGVGDLRIALCNPLFLEDLTLVTGGDVRVANPGVNVWAGPGSVIGCGGTLETTDPTVNVTLRILVERFRV